MKCILSCVGAAILFAVAPTSLSEGSDENRAPDLKAAVGWINSVPLNGKMLHGKVVLVNFWTYSCINSLRELPYMKAWAAKYREAGLVVVGVHSPEFRFETEPANVRTAVSGLNISYPIAIDSQHSIWNSFRNEYWPADYLIDGKGRLRYRHFGEGEYDSSERMIQKLLRENGATGVDESMVRISAQGAEAPPSDEVKSPETYIGYARTENFESSARAEKGSGKRYTLPVRMNLNHWGLAGGWSIGSEHGTLQTAPGSIVFRFHSRDVHMVLAPARGRVARFRIRLNGSPPGEHHGADSTADGAGEIREPRMYQLIRQKGPIKDANFEIEILDPGVDAFSFTFG